MEVTRKDLKKRIEALLFSSAARMAVEDIDKLAKIDNIELTTDILNELRDDYENKESSLAIVNDGRHWKQTIHDEQLPYVKKVVTEPELSKTMLETLAVIAYKSPMKQSDLIKIRTNKAYDHIVRLKEEGYITSEKYGRTRLLRLSSKFFDYFDVPPEKLKEKFSRFSSAEGEIKKKELEAVAVRNLMEDKARKRREEKSEDERIREALEHVETENQEQAAILVPEANLAGFDKILPPSEEVRALGTTREEIGQIKESKVEQIEGDEPKELTDSAGKNKEASDF